MVSAKKEREYYEQYRAGVCDNFHITIAQYNTLARLGEALTAIYEESCETDMPEEEYEERTDHVKQAIIKYLQAIGLTVFMYLQTDPRGAALYLSKEPITQVNYTNGHCIY